MTNRLLSIVVPSLLWWVAEIGCENGNRSVDSTTPEIRSEMVEGTGALYEKLARQTEGIGNTLIAFSKADSLYLMTSDGRYQAKVGYGSWLSWSPSGNHISFRDQTWEKIGTRHFTMNWRTQSQVEVDLNWSPDGRKGVTAVRDGGYSIYVMDADGNNPVRLTDGGGPIWSPDGSMILFRTGSRTINIMNADGTNATEIAQGVPYSFSPSSQRVLYNGFPDDATSIDVVNVDGSNNRRLKGPSSLFERTPQWSPDGSKILYHRRPYYYVMAADGENEIMVGWSAGSDVDHAWSPDGNRIVFLNHALSPDGTYRSYIHVVSSFGMEEVQLGIGKFFSWSPDGVKIALGIQEVVSQGGREKEFIYVMNPDGTERVKLSEGTRPMWSPFIKD